MSDDDLALGCALAQAGLHDLGTEDVAFLLEAFLRMKKPLEGPAGFSITTPVSLSFRAALEPDQDET